MVAGEIAANHGFAAGKRRAGSLEARSRSRRDITGFLDNIDHELLLRAVRKHTKFPRIALNVVRWLKAPASMADGSLLARDRGTPQGAVISPLLENLCITCLTWLETDPPA
ncbi:hypothetical protein [Mesorhizobium sp. J8]|uniref:hypothetical protein n=1 Tax=Mesorhizobium sp. J8 TaxID=2777475 RepID=UPI001915473D|nr:hypothetical protein [Mesorhizobium sp. J8]BCM17658.1 group II intron reverse transcriptase/maturase [Mesorhizobium sp. J8]